MAKKKARSQAQGLKILYIEDEIDTFEPLFSYIQKTFGEESVGVRSVEAARRALSEGRKPDFAMHDCRLPYQDDGISSIRAGDELYVKLCGLGIPVFVISGDDTAVEEEPYLSKPPVLGFMPKPVDQKIIDVAVELFHKQFADKTE